VRCDVDLDPEPGALVEPLDRLDRLVDDPLEWYPVLLQRQPVRVELAELEHVVDEVGKVPRVPVDRGEVRPERRVESPCADRRVGDHLAEADDQVERGAELVADRGGELLLEAARLVGGAPRLRQRGVRVLQPLDDVGQALRQLGELGLALADLDRLAPLLQVASPGPAEHRAHRPVRDPAQPGTNGDEGGRRERRRSIEEERGTGRDRQPDRAARADDLRRGEHDQREGEDRLVPAERAARQEGAGTQAEEQRARGETPLDAEQHQREGWQPGQRQADDPDVRAAKVEPGQADADQQEEVQGERAGGRPPYRLGGQLLQLVGEWVARLARGWDEIGRRSGGRRRLADGVATPARSPRVRPLPWLGEVCPLDYLRARHGGPAFEGRCGIIPAWWRRRWPPNGFARRSITCTSRAPSRVLRWLRSSSVGARSRRPTRSTVASSRR